MHICTLFKRQFNYRQPLLPLLVPSKYIYIFSRNYKSLYDFCVVWVVVKCGSFCAPFICGFLATNRFIPVLLRALNSWGPLLPCSFLVFYELILTAGWPISPKAFRKSLCLQKLMTSRSITATACLTWPRGKYRKALRASRLPAPQRFEDWKISFRYLEDIWKSERCEEKTED